MEYIKKQEVNTDTEYAVAEIEGGNTTWWYVCSECREQIDWKQPVCNNCKRRIGWNV